MGSSGNRILSLLLVAVGCGWTFAEPIVYDVDISAQEPGGPEMSISGSITADPELDTITSSELLFHFDGAAGIPIEATPIVFQDSPAFSWNITPAEIRFERLSETTGDRANVDWFGESNGFEANLHFGTGPAWHTMEYFNVENGDSVLYDLKLASGPDFPGYLLGTAVPEPTCALLLGIGLACLPTSRRRHRPRQPTPRPTEFLRR